MNSGNETLADKLVAHSHFESSDEAARWIRRGRVIVNGERVYDPEATVAQDSDIKIIRRDSRYVSRGGLKLEHALKAFHADVFEKVCVDIGASTGGFTDCLLGHGAARVYAVDVGYGILDWRLRNHPNVVVMERTNARKLTRGDFPETIDLAVIDVSHISLELVIPPVADLLSDDGIIIALIKPQFEIPREWTGESGFERGVIVDCGLLRRVIDYTVARLGGIGFHPGSLAESPISGAKGNREFFALFEYPFSEKRDIDYDIVDSGTPAG